MISRVMWLIKGKHRHLKAEVLSEYLDGRLEGAALARVERSLAECSACREDLDSLQATVAAIRRLPVEAPARDFVMAAPPFRPARPRPTPLARASMWAYAGAASVAALVLTVLASADATGLLAPSQPGFEEASTAAFDAPVAMEDYQSDTAVERAEALDDSMEMAEEAAATTAPAITADPIVEMALAEAADDSMATADGEADATAAPTIAAEPTAEMALADEEFAAASEPLATAAAADDSTAMAGEEADAAPRITAEPTAAMEPDEAFDESEGMMAAEPAAGDALDADESMAAMDDVEVADDFDAMPAADSAPESADTLGDSDAMPAADLTAESTDVFDDSDAMAPADAFDDEDTTLAADSTDESTGDFDDSEAMGDADSAAVEAAKTAAVEAAEAAAAEAAQAAAVALSAEAQSVETAVEEGQTPEEPAPTLALESQEQGTALYWRILQGIAGALALLFLAAFAVKWRASRVDGAARG